MNPNEFGLYMIILPHEARFCTIFGKIFKENEKSQPLWLTLNDLYFALNMDFQRKNPIFAYKTSYFQFGTLKYIDVFKNCPKEVDEMFKMRRRAGYSIFRRNFPEVSPFISARFFVSCTESAGDGRSGGNLGKKPCGRAETDPGTELKNRFHEKTIQNVADGLRASCFRWRRCGPRFGRGARDD